VSSSERGSLISSQSASGGERGPVTGPYAKASLPPLAVLAQRSFAQVQSFPHLLWKTLWKNCEFAL